MKYLIAMALATVLSIAVAPSTTESGLLDTQPLIYYTQCLSQMQNVGNSCPNANGCTSLHWIGFRCAPTTLDVGCQEFMSANPVTVIVQVGYCSGSQCELTGEVYTLPELVPVCNQDVIDPSGGAGTGA